MELITHEDYLEFVSKHREVEIEGVKVPLKGPYKPKILEPPNNYLTETSTVWSFPERGEWATHIGNYRGNWSPYIPRNLILQYTQPGELVLDQMAGSGTTLVECKLLGRAGIGVDINKAAVMVMRDRLFFEYKRPSYWPPECLIHTYIGDARNLDRIADETIDLIATHPPYAGIIAYSKGKVKGDLSALKIDEYLQEMQIVAQECFRVLKAGRYCAILIGDTRKHLHYIPIAYRVMEIFLESGFILKEDIIKRQWGMRRTLERWRGRQHNFYKIAHEHLFIFRKPFPKEKLNQLRYSLKIENTK